ncbi:hypothetical protein JCM11641_000218 [Rhodosporidiobolus odoratus]
MSHDDGYALLHLEPAVTTTVVTTTTQTKTSFAPIRIPKTRSIRPSYSSFSGPSGADAFRSSVPLTPRSSIRRLLDAEDGDAASSSSALRLNPMLYPLSQAQWPGSLKRFKVDLGGMQGVFVENAAEVPPEASWRPAGARSIEGSERDPKGKGKERSFEDDELEDELTRAPHLPRADRGALHHRRMARRSRGSMGGIGEVSEDGIAEGVDAEGGISRHDRSSPGPPRKRPRAESASIDRRASIDAQLDAVAPAAAARVATASGRPSQVYTASYPLGPSANSTTINTLPSPNQSPPSPVPTFGGEDSQELKDDDELVEDGTHELEAQAFDFGSGAALSGLFSLPDLVNTFDQLAPSLQSYLIFQLLRRSSIPVLQTLNQIIEPSLRRDFLSDLPPELGVHILCYLDAKTLCRASLVSRKWRRLIDGEWRIWKGQLVKENLWVGDGSEEKEAREIATGGTENLFLKRWKAGVWDQKRPCAWNGKVEYENLYVSGVGGDLPRFSVSHRLASPSSSREASPFPPSQSVHPFKLLYRRRFLTRNNWKHNAPKRTTFPSAPQNPPAANNPHNNHVVTCLQFDEDKIVSASDDHLIHVFDTQTGALRTSLAGHEGGVWALQYVGNVLVSGSTDRTVRVWDLDTGRCTHTFIGHTSTVRCLQIVEPRNINPDPRGAPIWEPAYPLIATGSRDWSLRVWKLPMPGKDAEYHPIVPQSPTEENTAPDHNPYHLRHLAAHNHAVRALAAHGRTLVSGSYDTTVRVWDIITGECRHELRGHTQKVYSVVYDHRRQLCASGSMDGHVRLWSTETGECRATLEGHTSLVGLLGLSHRNLVSAAADWTLRIWDPESGECKHALAAHQGAITCFQHDEHKVISGSDGTLKMWDVESGELIRDLITNLTGVWQVSFNQRFCVAAVSRNNNSEFEVLDFGRVEPDPPVLERYSSSPFHAVKREEDEEGDPYGYSSTVNASGSAGCDASLDVTMSDLPPQDATPLANPYTASAAHASSVSRFRADGLNHADSPLSASSSTASLPGASSSSRRTVRRTDESRDLGAQARAQAGSRRDSGAEGSSARTGRMEVERDEEDPIVEVKAEEVEE